FDAAWEPGQYASVFDPAWTVADVFHFEAARYYNIKTYASYQVTVTLEGRSRSYRAIALFRDGPDDLGPPEFWDTIVNGVGSVWDEKRPAYKAKTTLSVANTDANLQLTASTMAISDGGEIVSGDAFSQAGSTTWLPLWLSGDDDEHASGWHGGTAE